MQFYKEFFDKNDYWRTLEEFERNRKEDCKEFALWAWERFLDLNQEARFTYGSEEMVGHAWVTLVIDDKPYIFEATTKPQPDGDLQLLSVLSDTLYKPRVSIDKNFKFLQALDTIIECCWLQEYPYQCSQSSEFHVLCC